MTERGTGCSPCSILVLPRKPLSPSPDPSYCSTSLFHACPPCSTLAFEPGLVVRMGGSVFGCSIHCFVALRALSWPAITEGRASLCDKITMYAIIQPSKLWEHYRAQMSWYAAWPCCMTVCAVSFSAVIVPWHAARDRFSAMVQQHTTARDTLSMVAFSNSPVTIGTPGNANLSPRGKKLKKKGKQGT